MTKSENQQQRTVTTATAEYDKSPSTDEKPVKNHLDNLEDGAGCTEIWEHLSRQRDDKVIETNGD